MPYKSSIFHKNCETASPSPSVNVDWCYLGVTACKFALKTLFRITILTEGEGEVTGARKNMFLWRGQGGIKGLGFVMLVSI